MVSHLSCAICLPHSQHRRVDARRRAGTFRGAPHTHLHHLPSSANTAATTRRPWPDLLFNNVSGPAAFSCGCAVGGCRRLHLRGVMDVSPGRREGNASAGGCRRLHLRGLLDASTGRREGTAAAGGCCAAPDSSAIGVGCSGSVFGGEGNARSAFRRQAAAAGVPSRPPTNDLAITTRSAAKAPSDSSLLSAITSCRSSSASSSSSSIPELDPSVALPASSPSVASSSDIPYGAPLL